MLDWVKIDYMPFTSKRYFKKWELYRLTLCEYIVQLEICKNGDCRLYIVNHNCKGEYFKEFVAHNLSNAKECAINTLKEYVSERISYHTDKVKEFDEISDKIFEGEIK